jgi:hypothetical protein
MGKRGKYLLIVVVLVLRNFEGTLRKEVRGLSKHVLRAARNKVFTLHKKSLASLPALDFVQHNPTEDDLLSLSISTASFYMRISDFVTMIRSTCFTGL